MEGIREPSSISLYCSFQCAGRAKRRRRFGSSNPVGQYQSGVALRLPPHSKFALGKKFGQQSQSAHVNRAAVPNFHQSTINGIIEAAECQLCRVMAVVLDQLSCRLSFFQLFLWRSREPGRARQPPAGLLAFAASWRCCCSI